MINWRIVLLLITAAIAAACGAPRSKFEAGLLRVLERCKRGDVSSLPITVPSLKSLKVDPMQIKYDGYTVDISEATVKGLEQLSIDRLSASEPDLTVSLAFSVPSLDVRADKYHLQEKALFIPINNSGAFKAAVSGLKVKAVAQFAADGPNTAVKRLDIDYSVGHVQAHLGGSSSIVTNVFNAKLAKMLESDKKLVISMAKPVIEKMLRKTLTGFTPDKLIDVISNVS